MNSFRLALKTPTLFSPDCIFEIAFSLKRDIFAPCAMIAKGRPPSFPPCQGEFFDYIYIYFFKKYLYIFLYILYLVYYMLYYNLYIIFKKIA